MYMQLNMMNEILTSFYLCIDNFYHFFTEKFSINGYVATSSSLSCYTDMIRLQELLNANWTSR